MVLAGMISNYFQFIKKSNALNIKWFDPGGSIF